MNPELITFRASGELAESLRAMSFVSGSPIPDIVRNILDGFAGDARDPGRLIEDSFFCMGDDDGDVRALVDRFKAYRAARGLDYPDHVIEVAIADCTGEIDKESRELLVESGEIISGQRQPDRWSGCR